MEARIPETIGNQRDSCFFNSSHKASASDEGYLYAIAFHINTEQALIEGTNESVIKEASQTCSLRSYSVQGST